MTPIRAWILIGIGLACWPYLLSVYSLVVDWLHLLDGVKKKACFIIAITSMAAGALIVIECLVLRFF